MQTEAEPREPSTLRVLLRYRFTVFAVAVFVILGGYLRTVTQPSLYEATARLAVHRRGAMLSAMMLGQRSFVFPANRDGPEFRACAAVPVLPASVSLNDSRCLCYPLAN